MGRYELRGRRRVRLSAISVQRNGAPADTWTASGSLMTES
jgi:hypothetical protein